MDQQALTGGLSGWFHYTPPIKGAERNPQFMEYEPQRYPAEGGRFGSWIECRSVPARKNRLVDRLGLEEGPAIFTAAHQRVRLRSIATVHPVARVKIVRGGQYGWSSLACH